MTKASASADKTIAENRERTPIPRELWEPLLRFSDTLSGTPAVRNMILPLMTAGSRFYGCPAENSTAMMYPDDSGLSYPVDSSMDEDTVARRAFHPNRTFAVIVNDISFPGNIGAVQTRRTALVRTVIALGRNPEGRDCGLCLHPAEDLEGQLLACSRLGIPLIYDERRPESVEDPLLRSIAALHGIFPFHIRLRSREDADAFPVLDELREVLCRNQILRLVWSGFFRTVSDFLPYEVPTPGFDEESAARLIAELSFGTLSAGTPCAASSVPGWDDDDRMRFLSEKTGLLEDSINISEDISIFASTVESWGRCLATDPLAADYAFFKIRSPQEPDRVRGLEELAALGRARGMPELYQAIASGVPVEDAVA